MANRTCLYLLTVLFWALTSNSVALQTQMKSSDETILDAESKAAITPKAHKVGNGEGRPLFNLGPIIVPSWMLSHLDREEHETACVLASMETTKTGDMRLRADPSTPIPMGKQARQSHSVAHACFLGSMKTTGWGHLNISASTATGDFPLNLRMYAVGLVEGVLTFDAMTRFRSNTQKLLKMDVKSAKKGTEEAVEKALRMSLTAWEQLSGDDANTPPKDAVPRQAWAALIQLRGIRDGYNQRIAKGGGVPKITMYELLLMNMHAELPNVVEIMSRSQQATQPHAKASFLQKGDKEGSHRGGDKDTDTTNEDLNNVDWKRWASHMPRGSAIVRRIGPVGTPEDLLAGHVTHGNYGEMSRIHKTYDIDVGSPVKKIVMTSYPGCISSTDDYIMTSTGLVIMSTKLGIPDTSIFSRPLSSNEGLPNFLRAMIATRSSVEPRMWVKVYSYLTGIAGGNQWLLADYSKLVGHQKFKEGLVFFAETMPTLTKFGDVTYLVNHNGFFTANGMPHFAQIRSIYGLPLKGPGTYKEHLGSDLVDRAPNIERMSSARDLLRGLISSRGYHKTDIHQIPVSARNDLVGGHVDNYMPSSPIPEGGIDAKLTSRCFMQHLSLQAINGPPYFPYLVPPFEWKNWTSWPHDGLPSVYNFTWINMDQTGQYPLSDGAEASQNGGAKPPCSISGTSASDIQRTIPILNEMLMEEPKEWKGKVMEGPGYGDVHFTPEDKESLQSQHDYRLGYGLNANRVISQWPNGYDGVVGEPIGGVGPSWAWGYGKGGWKANWGDWRGDHYKPDAVWRKSSGKGASKSTSWAWGWLD